MDPERAVGKPHTLWVAFAKLYERHGDLPNARIIFEKAVQVRWCGAVVGRGMLLQGGNIGPPNLCQALLHALLACTSHSLSPSS